MILRKRIHRAIPVLSIAAILLICAAPVIALQQGVAAPTAGTSSPSAGVALRGRVIRAPGVPAPSQRVSITTGGNPALSGETFTKADGSFEFLNVPPGSYTLQISVPVPTQQIVVGNVDVNGIEFTAVPMKNVSGRVLVEGLGTVPRLAFTVVHPNGRVTLVAAQQPDGTMRLFLPEGEHRVLLDVPGYTVKSLTYRSIDLLKDPIKIASTDTEQLLVTLSANPSSTGARGDPAGVPPAVGPGTVTVSATNPTITYQIQPGYTDEARQARIQGAVTVRGVVRKDGTFDSLQVVQGLGFGLDEAALAAAMQWRFRPATRNGEAVDFPLTAQITFNLR
jgi:TonB family protein